MTARTHDIISFAALVTISTLNQPQNLNIATVGACLIGNIVGCLLPDIDQAGNRLWDLTPISGLTGQLGRKIFISHRSISHSLLGVAIFYWLLKLLLPVILNPNYIYVNVVFVSILIGYISHLVSDLFTKEGLPLLFPIRYKFGIPPASHFRIKTGGFLEKFVVFPLTLTYILWFAGKYHIEVFNLLRRIHP